MKLWRPLIISVSVVTLSGCNTLQGWFNTDDGEDLTAPVELERIDATVKLNKQWSTSIGDGQGNGFYRITPILENGVIYAASSDGEVAAIDAIDGSRLWRVELELSLIHI